MIFLTVGTEYPFDRLVKAIDALLENSSIDEEIFAQIGDSKYTPRYMKWISKLNKSEFDRLFEQSDAVISHAGMGTIMMCIESKKPLLVIPRKKGFGEIVNDHQVATAKKFQNRGQILVAYDILDLPERIQQLHTVRHTVRPLNVQSDKSGIIHYLEQYIVSLESR